MSRLLAAVVAAALLLPLAAPSAVAAPARPDPAAANAAPDDGRPIERFAAEPEAAKQEEDPDGSEHADDEDTVDPGPEAGSSGVGPTGLPDVSGPGGLLRATSAPSAIVITSPKAGATVPAGSTTFTGSSAAGTIQWWVDGVLGGQFSAGGPWKRPISLPTAGAHTVRFGYAGFPYGPFTSITINVSGATTPPAANRPTITITAPAEGTRVPVGPVTFTGTSAPGVAMTYSVDGDTRGTFSAPASGEWSLDVTVSTPGTHLFRLWYSDTPNRIVARGVIATAPVAPVVITSPDRGATYAADTAFRVTGTGEPGRVVHYTVDAEPARGSFVVPADGRWAFDTSIAARPGASDPAPHFVRAWYDGATPVDGVMQLVYVTEPLAVTSHHDGDVVRPGSITFRGTARPGAVVEYVDGDRVLASGTATAAGAWSITTALLVEGDVTATFRYRDAPTVRAAVALVVRGADLSPIRVSSPSWGAVLAAGPAMFVGTAVPGKQIAWSVDGVTRGEFASGNDGGWQHQVDLPLTGWHTVAFWYPANLSVTRAEVPVRVIAPVVVNWPADDTWHTGGTPVLMTGTAEPGELRYTVDGVGAGSVTVTPDGAWLTTLDLPAGRHRVEFTHALSDGSDPRLTASRTVTVVDVGGALLTVTAEAVRVPSVQDLG